MNNVKIFANLIIGDDSDPMKAVSFSLHRVALVHHLSTKAPSEPVYLLQRSSLFLLTNHSWGNYDVE